MKPVPTTDSEFPKEVIHSLTQNHIFDFYSKGKKCHQTFQKELLGFNAMAISQNPKRKDHNGRSTQNTLSYSEDCNTGCFYIKSKSLYKYNDFIAFMVSHKND